MCRQPGVQPARVVQQAHVTVTELDTERRSRQHDGAAAHQELVDGEQAGGIQLQRRDHCEYVCIGVYTAIPELFGTNAVVPRDGLFQIGKGGCTEVKARHLLVQFRRGQRDCSGQAAGEAA